MKEVIRIDGMSCGHCEGRVKSALTGLGVKVLKVSASENIAEVELTGNITLADVKKAIEDAGYDVV